MLNRLSLFWKFGCEAKINGRCMAPSDRVRVYSPLWLPILFSVVFIGITSSGAVLSVSAEAAEKPDYKDVYLTGNGVCKACRVEWVDRSRVRLVNREGLAAIVPAKAVIGIDRHPFFRKALLTSLHGIGLPGPLLVPAAFEDANDYVCKYCDSFNR